MLQALSLLSDLHSSKPGGALLAPTWGGDGFTSLSAASSAASGAEAGSAAQAAAAEVAGRWDLSDLFASHDDPRLDATLATSLEQAKAFEARYRGTIDVPGGPSPDHLLGALQTLEALDADCSRVSAYASLLYSCDTQSATCQDLVAKVEKKLTELGTHFIFFDLEWLELEDDVALSVMQAPELAPYRHHLARERSGRPYRRSEAEEKVMTRLRPTGPGALQKLYTEVQSALTFSVKKLDGKGREQVTISEVMPRLQHADRTIRKDGFGALYATLGEERVEHSVRFVYNTLIEDHLVRDEIRGYPSFMEARHLANETTAAQVTTMLDVVGEHYGLAHRYFRLKARMLGLGKLELYDQYAPVAQQSPHYTSDEARTLVLDAYHRFDPQFGQLAGEFFDKHWIDIFPRPGKRSGAFCYSPSPVMHPYVLTNFTGTARDVMTLAHELGHALHGQLSRKQSPLNYHPPLTTCETASVFGESLTFDHMLRGLDEAAELSLLCSKIEDTFATVFRQTVLTRFEQKVFERRKQGLLTADDFASAWLEVNAAYYGDAVRLTPGYEKGWSYIPHFINSRFYCYSYVFGQLLTMALYRLYLEQGAAFASKYVELLSAGSSASPAELFAPFGVDLADAAFWRRGFCEIERLVERAEALYRSTGRLRKR
jgi:oligoendopeptidase F